MHIHKCTYARSCTSDSLLMAVPQGRKVIGVEEYIARVAIEGSDMAIALADEVPFNAT